MRPQFLFAPTLHLANAQAYARFTPARPAHFRVSPSLACSGFAAQPKRTGAPPHPPPGCLRAANAARRALLDVSSNADGIAGIKEWGRYLSAGVLLLVLPILVVLPLGIWRPIRRIPAVAENGDSNPPPVRSP